MAGCPACHGASAPHTRAPTRVAPDVSFGPLWSSSAHDQDARCLACHASGPNGEAAHWRDALHMLNNLTCITCHDIHAERDKVLFPEEQAQVARESAEEDERSHALDQVMVGCDRAARLSDQLLVMARLPWVMAWVPAVALAPVAVASRPDSTLACVSLPTSPWPPTRTVRVGSASP